MPNTALVTGVTGQDGAYLAQSLLKRGYHVVGGYRRCSTPNLWRLHELGIADQVKLVMLDMLEESNIRRVLKKYEPDYIYNLAAQSFVAASFEQPIYTAEVGGIGVARLLESIRDICPKTRFYQASTSEMYGKVASVPQCETTPFYPRSPYGVAKLYAHWMTVNYREAHGIYACSGILFNHESPLRGPEFVTRKITSALARKETPVALGNLDAKRDWGFAPDYVEGMIAMLEADTPSDYVLATGTHASVRSFCTLAAAHFGKGIEWQGIGTDEVGIDSYTGETIFEVNPEFYRPAEVDVLLGDARKAQRELGWTATTSLANMITAMCAADTHRASPRRWQHDSVYQSASNQVRI
jgi:GDPmannose 4,6-dehydratase